MKRVPAVLLGLLASAFMGQTVAAPLEGQDQESRVLSDRWYFALGWFGADVSTDIAFGFGQVVGTSIRLEDDLDLAKRKDEGSFGFRYQFNRHSSISLATFSINRSAGSTIEREIDIEAPSGGNGLHFDAGATLDSTMDCAFVGVLYNYSFYNNGKIAAGISGGLSTYDFDLQLIGQAELVDEDGNTIGGTAMRTANTSLLAPIPVYGIFVDYAIRKNVIFDFQASALHLNVGDIEGRVSQTQGVVNWFFSRNVGVGGGVMNTSIEVQNTSDDGPWRVDYNYGGFVLHLNVVF